MRLVLELYKSDSILIEETIYFKYANLISFFGYDNFISDLFFDLMK